ncbi:hypothetical protein CHUAL_001814 [Chamberlinius hualienensis]
MVMFHAQTVLTVCLLVYSASAQLLSRASDNLGIDNVHVTCDRDHILVTLDVSTPFEGLIYPKGLPKNSSCMTQYASSDNRLKYSMPLWACNTMSNDVTDGVEYFNTIVVQPHRRLVTNQGKGYHIRCKYQTKTKLLLNNVNVSDVTPNILETNVPIPEHNMKIHLSQISMEHVAENVNIGDNLTMHVTLGKQDIYGMKITNCFVRDGLNWNEQLLVNEEGCPLDADVMGPFAYSTDKTEAIVEFQAHKFPYTPTVYYKCNIKLCLKQNGGCNDVPPLCTSDGRNLRRIRRQVDPEEKFNRTSQSTTNSKDLSVAVYSGLHVGDSDNLKSTSEEPLPNPSPSNRESGFCMSSRDFAIGIAVAGLILMLAVLLLVALLIRRRRRRKDASATAASSIYSGPYSNPAFSSN